MKMQEASRRITWIRQRLSRSWLVGAHIVLAIFWLVMMPGGFPIEHPRFWVNRVLPALFLAACGLVAVGSWRGHRAALRGLLVAMGAFWAGMAVSVVFLFPSSIPKAVPGALLPSILVWLAVFSRHMRTVKLARACFLAATAIGALSGALAAITQRSPAAATIPLGQDFPATARSAPANTGFANSGIFLDRVTGEVSLQRGRYLVAISPLLTFTSRSPDRCWTNMASRRDREGVERRLLDTGTSAEGTAWVRYADDDQSFLQVTAETNDEIEICAWSRLPQNVFSHLNSFSQVTVQGHAQLDLLFSPCGTGVEPQFSEYPVGAPLQCAAMFADGRFSVLRASSAEKGPFATLSSGRLARGEPLTLTMRDQGRDVMAISWFDFSAQASVDLSPTAGYGLPMNAIEFSLYGREPSSTMGLYMTLAGTSVGRGWDSVGHRAGIYRNRMRILWLAP